MDAVQIMTRQGDFITLDKKDLRSLVGQLRGSLFCAEDGDYNVARKVWNGMIDKIQH